jgi:hypothetical protein
VELEAPESVIVAAEIVPDLFVAPETTMVSPGRTALRLTDSRFETLVAELSDTLTVLPEDSVSTMVLPLTLWTVPNEALPPPAAPVNPLPL